MPDEKKSNNEPAEVADEELDEASGLDAVARQLNGPPRQTLELEHLRNVLALVLHRRV